jgi:CBS domain-containing protein
MALDRFKSALVTASVEDTVESVAQSMRERRVGSVLITRAGRPAGLVTDRDIVLRVVAEGRDATREKIGAFTTYDPLTVSVHDGIETVVARMRRHGVRRLPIVDDQGVAVGIVTADDLLVLLGGEIAAVCEGIENRSDAVDSR